MGYRGGIMDLQRFQNITTFRVVQTGELVEPLVRLPRHWLVKRADDAKAWIRAADLKPVFRAPAPHQIAPSSVNAKAASLLRTIMGAA